MRSDGGQNFKTCPKKTQWAKKQAGNLGRNQGLSSKCLEALPTGLHTGKKYRS